MGGGVVNAPTQTRIPKPTFVRRYPWSFLRKGGSHSSHVAIKRPEYYIPIKYTTDFPSSNIVKCSWKLVVQQRASLKWHHLHLPKFTHLPYSTKHPLGLPQCGSVNSSIVFSFNECVYQIWTEIRYIIATCAVHIVPIGGLENST